MPHALKNVKFEQFGMKNSNMVTLPSTYVRSRDEYFLQKDVSSVARFQNSHGSVSELVEGLNASPEIYCPHMTYYFLYRC